MMLTGSLQLSVYITRLICKAAHLLYGIWKPRLQWHYKHTLETTDSFPFFVFFFFIFFFTKWYKQQYKIFVLLTIYKKSLLTR